MNVAELYKQVAQLGFEDSLDDSDRFYYAANRALLQVCKIRPAVGYYLINHKPLTNLVANATFSPVEKIDDLIYEATCGKSYYFEADGNGVLYVEKHNADTDEWEIIKQVELSSKQTFVPYRGFIKKDGSFIDGLIRLRFTGEYIYSIKGVAIYQNLLSGDAADIPAYEPYTRYDIKQLTTDFLALCCPPIDEADGHAVLNQEYALEGDSTILLPYDKKGVYKALYERRPKAIANTGETTSDEAIIDLDDELCSLLPILIASYVWVDDEPSKSEYYLSLYRERVQEISYKQKNNAPVYIKNTNGW